MYIEIIKPSGFCAGVKGAIDACLSIKEKTEFNHYYTYGEIVHNDNVVKRLESIGIIALKPSLDSLKILTKDDCLIFTAHGLNEMAKAYLEKNDIMYFDTTCPFVLRNKEFIEMYEGDIIYIAKANHPEARAIASLDLNKKLFIYDQDTKELEEGLKDVSIVCQTTLAHTDTEDDIALIKKMYPDAKVFPSICNASITRQDAIINLDPKFNVLLVVGSLTSSNTDKLYKLGLTKLSRVYKVNDVNDLSGITFNDTDNIAIISGASSDISDALSIKEYLENARF